MSDIRVRQAIARRAAQLMYARDESEYFTAKRKAAREFGLDARYRPKDLPSNTAVREQIEVLAASRAQIPSTRRALTNRSCSVPCCRGMTALAMRRADQAQTRAPPGPPPLAWPALAAR